MVSCCRLAGSTARRERRVDTCAILLMTFPNKIGKILRGYIMCLYTSTL
jgi:hypothetical protein